MIDLMRRTYNVRELCDVLEVSRSAYARVVIDDLQKSHNRTAPGNRRKQSAFIPFNRKTAAWRQEKRRRK